MKKFLILALFCASSLSAQTITISTQSGSNGTAFGSIARGSTSYPLFFILSNTGGLAGNGIALANSNADFTIPAVASLLAEPLQYQGSAQKCIISTISESVNTVTVTCTQAFTTQANQRIQIFVALNSGYNGVFRVTPTGSTTFTYTDPTSGLATATTGSAVADPYAPCGTSLGAGLKCYIPVVFAPSGTSGETDTLTVGGSNFSSLTENLSGTGVSGTAITTCPQTLSGGVFYYLTADLTYGGTCFTVSGGSNGINLNGNYHKLTFGTATNEVFTTDSTDTVSAGNVTLTPNNMSQVVGTPWNIQTNASLLLDTGANQETVTVTGTTGTTFSAVTTKSHTAPFTVVGAPVNAINILSNQNHQIYGLNIIQGNCQNPSSYATLRSSDPITINGGGLGSTGLGQIHDLAISNCADSSQAISVDFNNGGQSAANYYNLTITPNVVTAMRRAEYKDFACMVDDANGHTTVSVNLHDVYCVGTMTGGGISWGSGGSVGTVNNIYDNYVSAGNPNGTFNGNGTFSGNVSVTNGSPTVTWVSGFLGTAFQPDIEGPDWSVGGGAITIGGNSYNIVSVAPNGKTMTLSANYGQATNASIAGQISLGQNCVFQPYSNAAGTAPANAGGQCTNDYGYNLAATSGGPATNLVVNDLEGRGLTLTNEVSANGLSNSTVFSALEYANNQEYVGCTLGGGYGFELKQTFQGGGDPSGVFLASGLIVNVMAQGCVGTAYRAHDPESFTNVVTTGGSYTSTRLGTSQPSCATDTLQENCSIAILLDTPSVSDGETAGDLKFTSGVFNTPSSGETFSADSCIIWPYFGLSTPAYTRRPLLYNPTFVNGTNNSTYHHFFCKGESVNTNNPVTGAVVDPTFNNWSFTDIDMPSQTGGTTYPHFQMYRAFTQTVAVTSGGNPVNNASVTWTDGHSNSYTCTTGSNGICPPVNTTTFGFDTQPIPPIQDRTNNDTAANQDDTGYNPQSFTVTASGCNNYSQSGITINKVNTWNVSMTCGNQVATPTFSPPGGNYATAQSVTLSDSTSGATICYTVNGSTPTAGTAGTCDSNGGTEFTYSTPINVSVSTTINAIGTKSGSTNSTVGSAIYSIGSSSQVLLPPQNLKAIPQ